MWNKNKPIGLILSLILLLVMVLSCTPTKSQEESPTIITITGTQTNTTLVPEQENQPSTTQTPSTTPTSPSTTSPYISPVILLSPIHGAVDVPVNTTFKWSGVNNAANYEFVIAEELGRTDKFSLIDYIASASTNSHRPTITLKSNTQYWWRVRAVNSTGTKSTWTASSFTTVGNSVIPSTTPPTLPPTEVITIGEATVVQVIDGDTIEVSISGMIYRVRYIGIDTPETSEPFYLEATTKNAELVSGKTVRLEKDVSETDKYGRLLRYVYIGDLFVNAELVRSGYAKAVTYEPDTKFQSFFESLEQEAKLAFRGMWAKKYVGSKASNKYHFPNCSWALKINPENEIWFYSAADAQSHGYEPCGVCKPPIVD